MFKLTFSTSNSAFVNEDGSMCLHEFTRILDKVSTDVVLGRTSGSVIDTNGNKVGEWSLE